VKIPLMDLSLAIVFKLREKRLVRHSIHVKMYKKDTSTC